MYNPQDLLLNYRGLRESNWSLNSNPIDAMYIFIKAVLR